MSDKQRNYWSLGTTVAGVVVGAVAALLLAIIATARDILSNATRALAVANEIVTNTRPIWELEQTNTVAGQLLDEARRIEQHATQLADALEAPQSASPPVPPAV